MESEDLPGRDPHQELLGFLKSTGADIELIAASTLREVGFSVGQGVGVRTYVEPPLGFAAGKVHAGESPPPEPVAREVDLIAMLPLAADGSTNVTLVLAVECKSLRGALVALLQLQEREVTHEDTDILVGGRFYRTTPKSRFAPKTDASGFKLIAKPRKQDTREPGKAYDPIYNAMVQLLDAVDNSPSVFPVQEMDSALVVPVLVVDADLFSVTLDQDLPRADARPALCTTPIQTARVRVAAHGPRINRAVFVATLDGLRDLAESIRTAATSWIPGVLPEIANLPRTNSRRLPRAR